MKDEGGRMKDEGGRMKDESRTWNTRAPASPENTLRWLLHFPSLHPSSFILFNARRLLSPLARQ
jgi:hypothetical protein